MSCVPSRKRACLVWERRLALKGKPGEVVKPVNGELDESFRSR
jgi:hypothetical protein